MTTDINQNIEWISNNLIKILNGDENDIEQAFLRDTDCKNIYVHCQCGINRSGFLCLNFMVKRLNIPLNDAIKCILKQRPCALTNASFRNQVIQNSFHEQV